MRILCLWSPHLSAALAVRQRPALAGRPFVVIAGRGDDALVADASPPALAEGVLTGMRAGQARYACPGAVSVPDNAGACLEELERVGGIAGRRFGLRWAAGGREHLLFALDGQAGTGAEVRLASQAAAVAAAWSGLEFRAGVASTVAAARAAARAARRWPAIEPHDERGEEGEAVNPLPGELAAGTAVADEPGVADTVVALGRKLERMLTAYEASYREATLELTANGQARAWRLRLPAPLHSAAEAAQRLAAALPGGTAAEGVRLALGRLGPDVRVRPCAAALGGRRASRHEAALLRRAG
jgi:hypothetical protein